MVIGSQPGTKKAMHPRVVREPRLCTRQNRDLGWPASVSEFAKHEERAQASSLPRRSGSKTASAYSTCRALAYLAAAKTPGADLAVASREALDLPQASS